MDESININIGNVNNSAGRDAEYPQVVDRFDVAIGEGDDGATEIFEDFSSDARNPDEEVAQKYSFFQKIGYTPTPIQDKIHRSTCRFVVWAGGARSGKSMAAGYEAAFYLLLYPDFRIWIVGTQYELAEKEFMWCLDALGRFRVNSRLEYDPSGRPITEYFRISAAARGSKEIHTPWGSFVKTKSTEKPQTLLGEELNLIIMAEASQIPRSVWSRQLRMRIGPRKGLVKAFSTPNDDGGLFNEFKDNTLKRHLPDWDFYQSSVLENTHFPREEFEIMKETLSKKDFAEQAEGKFISRRGLIFEPEKWIGSIIKPEKFLDFYRKNNDMESWPVIAGMHKGYKNPGFVVYTRLHLDDRGRRRLLVYKARQYQEQLISDILQDIVTEARGKQFRGCVIDLFDSQLQAEFRNSPLTYSSNDDEKKIGRLPAIQQRMQGTLDAFIDGRIIILEKDCKDLVNCLENAKWNELSEKDKEKGKMESEIPNSIWMQGIYALSHVASFAWSSNYKWYEKRQT